MPKEATATNLYPNNGLREYAGNNSENIPNTGKTIT